MQKVQNMEVAEVMPVPEVTPTDELSFPAARQPTSGAATNGDVLGAP